ncbi:hypothetical protein VNO77_20385 [Canavalia gladiata]|uniref:Uncharacterized protein n=1 Tax=Canavalia gladiata TaxID=3824 RepID=A0AAN9LPE2_CANGL
MLARLSKKHLLVVLWVVHTSCTHLSQNTLPFDIQSPRICDSNAIMETVLREPYAHIKARGYGGVLNIDRVLSSTIPGSGFIYGVHGTTIISVQNSPLYLIGHQASGDCCIQCIQRIGKKSCPPMMAYIHNRRH